MTKTVTALTFCLTLLLAPTTRAEGASSGSVDAHTLLKDLQLYDLVLSPAEAARGGWFSFTIPLRRGGEPIESQLRALERRNRDGRGS